MTHVSHQSHVMTRAYANHDT